MPSGGLAQLASHVGVGAFLEQQLDGARAAVGGRCHERSGARSVLRVDLCALVEQQTHGIDVAAKRGGAERRQPVERRHVGIAAVVEQQPQNRQPVSKERCLIDRTCDPRPA